MVLLLLYHCFGKLEKKDRAIDSIRGIHMALTWKERISTIPYRVFLSKRCAKIFPIQWLSVILALIVGLEFATWWTV